MERNKGAGKAFPRGEQDLERNEGAGKAFPRGVDGGRHMKRITKVDTCLQHKARQLWGLQNLDREGST